MKIQIGREYVIKASKNKMASSRAKGKRASLSGGEKGANSGMSKEAGERRMDGMEKGVTEFIQD